MGLFPATHGFGSKANVNIIQNILSDVVFSNALPENFNILLRYFASFHSTDTVSKQVFFSKLLEMSHKINDLCLTFKYF